MTPKERIFSSAIIAGIGGIVVFWIVQAVLGISCEDLFGSSRFAKAETSFAASATITIVLFIFVYVHNGNNAPDKVQKITTLALSCWGVLWLAYVFLDDDICSSLAWRTYVVTLIVPALIASIFMIGRDWLEQNDE